MTTLLEDLGGEPAVRAAVEDFYGRLLRDESLMGFFRGVDMGKLKEHQHTFLSTAFAGIPPDFDAAKIIETKHSHLFARGLNETHFDMVAAHFAATLRDLQVKPDLIDKAIGVLAPLRPIFERGAIAAAA
mmetsp:Transcript_33740/g.107831  ORF Transcript_33740/g.107831 Transcript_33740/m.107831 type:complete len:130 (-) Transcript_33740:668-1057(-)|eukprot:CAMPEP_0118891580 /NCGR_PEP_ID=MMETSP1166-20130328/1538_1 /TAXON_ID=1104430 /ORGANISM="Chrysoreinhardia sp, Strain CCMP3193" /LENGTH=129 /DNA_ID=CAMNT_0006830249 /DNA_START=69 /DNA_END=458 /DNA_ORIENTATION=-